MKDQLYVKQIQKILVTSWWTYDVFPQAFLVEPRWFTFPLPVLLRQVEARRTHNGPALEHN